MYRRQFLKALAASAAATYPLLNTWPTGGAHAAATPQDLAIGKRTLEVNGRAATVFGLTGPGGKPGLELVADTDFNVRLHNDTEESTLIHWHGLTPPWHMDGVPDNPAALLTSKQNRIYNFPVGRGGTHWMHAHTLQEQSLLAAPLIVRTAEDLARDEQDVVILLHDFSFKSPEELLAGLKSGSSTHGEMNMGHQGMMQRMMPMMKSGEMPMNHQGMTMPGMADMDVNDIEYDAYLANDRTLDDPEVVRVEKGGRIRLRIINGATATAFTIDTGAVAGSLVAVDGQDIIPVAGNRFPISMGQRVDIRLQLPSAQKSFPILALREGAAERTGIILATPEAAVTKISAKGSEMAPVLDLALEEKLRAAVPLVGRSPARRYGATLMGDMVSYAWAIETSESLNVNRNERVRITMRNMSMMSHPMHLHGHHFQVVEINGTAFSGAVRDTVMLPMMSQVVIEFDADNTGRWPLHCHHLYHMAAGMMSFVSYDDA
ncbi:multicopper oxidase domain-containing protein [Rhizobium sp. TRM95111]|uniref:multicopper oxidase family protein n=1 Tax=Rhizobium alarense TaxID=2846851 RepID=UPI001F44210E|nr:multicopper oxidase domain-containing protein [Rhizobium alarense]MCF3639643.1 multicopper oxidase domain-containing protein [Rhizobium alarense]